MLPPRTFWAAGALAGLGSAAKPWGMAALGVAGAGALFGAINPDRGMFSGAYTGAKGMVSGAFTGGLMGAMGGAALSRVKGGFNRGMLGGAASGGRLGALGGAIMGAAFGLMKAGVTANRPVNRIRGLHQ